MGAIELPLLLDGLVGHVDVSVSENTDPEALGCRPAARGFPYCVAFVAHPALGFAWGFARELGEIRSHGPQPLSGRDWDVHKGLLEHEHPDWSFERRSNREGVAGGPRKAADA